MSGRLTVAAAQFAPVFLDRDATVEKAADLMADAARQGVRLLVFPEAFVPGYPCWAWKVAAGEDDLLRSLYAEYLESSVSVPSPAVDRLCAAARRCRINVVLGISERDAAGSRTSMFNSLLFLDERGTLLGRHRKLVPTGGERLIWGHGDGSTLGAFDFPFGRVGGLICWENYMPLARYSLYATGAQVYCAPTWDRGEPWLSTLRHIGREGGVFVIGAGMALHGDHVPDRLAFKPRFDSAADNGWINPGDSAIADPTGALIAGPLHGEEGLLTVELDLDREAGPKWELDVAGHYARPDVFQLTVNREERPVVR
ncbi:MAG: carbon-nitrogen hydrolase family protein [Deltaproteobacteria bacterium]|nr:carbon-nitrogen hydrolase family protein [Deltaproteobacteria bacterium]